MQETKISLTSGISLTLLSENAAKRGGRYRGIGAVVDTHSGTALRKTTRPILPDVRTPDGAVCVDYEIALAEITPERIHLELIPFVEISGGTIMEWMLHTVRQRRRTLDLWGELPVRAANSRLHIEIRPVTRTLGGEVFRGFSTQYRWLSDQYPIYKITDRATWEIGGEASGNELWWRSGVVPSITHFATPEQFYSSEWYLPGIAQPNIFQFHPLQTATPGFIQTEHPKGTLWTWASQVGHVRSLVEKGRGQYEVAHWHELCGDLAHEFDATPLEVLWHEGGESSFVARANRYERIRSFVSQTLHEEIGMREERVTTYGTIEEWNDVDMARYARVGLPKLIDANVKTVMLCNQMENNMNVWGVSNMCCTVDYKIAASVGEENIREFCQTSNDHGVVTEMWANTALSTLDYIFDMRNGKAKAIEFLPREGSFIAETENAKARWVQNPTGAPEADHYSPVFCALNLRDPVVFDAFVAAWKRAHDNLGLRGMFIDSSFNLSSDKWHWRGIADPDDEGGATLDQTDRLGFFRPAQAPPAAILSQYRAYLDLVVALQKIGYRISGEDLGLFTVSRSGPDVNERLGSLPLWTDSLCNFDRHLLAKAGVTDTDAVFFQGLSVRQMWYLYWNDSRDSLSWHHAAVRGDFDHPTEWQLSLLRAYNEVFPIMAAGTRALIPSPTAPDTIGGVLWTDAVSGKRALWAWEPLSLPLEEASTIHNVLSGAETEASHSVSVERHSVYQLTPKTGTKL